jgi:hypothetical protein
VEEVGRDLRSERRTRVGIKTLSAKSNKRGIKYASLSKTEKQHLIFTATS